MSRPIIDGILTMSNNAINKTLIPLIILLLEQNTLGANHLILHKYLNEKNKTKQKQKRKQKQKTTTTTKDVNAFYILYT